MQNARRSQRYGPSPSQLGGQYGHHGHDQGDIGNCGHNKTRNDEKEGTDSLSEEEPPLQCGEGTKGEEVTQESC